MTHSVRFALSLLLVVFMGISGLLPVHAAALPDSPDIVPFSAIGMPRDVFLQGPLARTALRFTLPPEWRLQGGATLRLNVTVLVSNFLVGQEVRSLDDIYAGEVSVMLNGVPLGAAFMQGGGQRTLHFDLGEAALAASPDGLHELVIQWDSTASCGQNVAASLSVQAASSYLVLPHQPVSPSTDLDSYPGPFFTFNNPRPAPVTLAVPDDASPAVLQGALAVASSLGRLSGGSLDFSMVTAGQLSRAKHADSHLILLGSADEFEPSKGVRVPTLPNASDGVLHSFISPWSSVRMGLLVTGADDAAILKAALALAGGQVITGREKSTAFVSAAFVPQVPALKVEQTFAELVGEPLVFSVAGVSTRDIPFYVPPGSAIGADATLDLAFAHAQLLDFLRSGIVIRLNGVSIGSIRLSDASSNLNTVRLILPASAVRAGVNTLEIQVEITARDACSDWRSGALFVTIFPESVLRLPASSTPILALRSTDLGSFPAPFAETDLSGTTFVLPPDDADSWTAAGRLAFSLGAQGAGISTPNVQVVPAGGSFTPEAGDYIVIGQPGRASAIAALGSVLPVPFAPDGQITTESQSRVSYGLDPARSAGFLQVAVLPGGTTSVLLVAGNNSQGLDWASQALTDPAALRRMSGANFVVLQSRATPKPFRVDAPQPITAPIPGAVGEVVGETPGQGGQSTGLPPRQDGWALPLLILSTLALLALAVVEIRSWRKR